MAKPVQKREPVPAASGAIADPDSVFGPPPLLDGEDETEYRQMLGRIETSVAPSDMIETIWVRDIADLSWEILRYRRLKARYMRVATAKEIPHILRRVVPVTELRDAFQAIWMSGGPEIETEIMPPLREAGYDRQSVEARALAKHVDTFERFDKLIAQAEARRNGVLREVDRRRDALARRAREAIAEIEDAEFEDVVDYTSETT